jgi:SAM-dependent methyltransferase
LRRAIRNALDSVGLLEPARALRAPWLQARSQSARERYYRRLVSLYRDPEALLVESYDAFEQHERDAGDARIVVRFGTDQRAILAAALDRFGVACEGPHETGLGARLERAMKERGVAPAEAERIYAFLRAITGAPETEGLAALGARIASQLGRSAAGAAASSAGDDRTALLRAILDRVVEEAIVPKFYDCDHVEDIRGIVAGRYCGARGPHREFAARIERALLALVAPAGATAGSAAELPAALRGALGPAHGYVPRRGDVTRHVRDTIPELAEEFIALKAERNPQRFLEINREYSRRQATAQGLWDNRQLSLLRGYERNHHALLRALVELVSTGELRPDDEVLLVGPRHIDEVAFFRQHLGLPRTVGLDLFPYGKDEILAGDMHDMPFASGRFSLVYCAGTLSYAYNARTVLEEMARVLRRPGFVFLVDAAGRHAGPDALGRSDVVDAETLVGMFYPRAFDVLVKDAGRSLAPDLYANEPCLALRLRAGDAA